MQDQARRRPRELLQEIGRREDERLKRGLSSTSAAGPRKSHDDKKHDACRAKTYLSVSRSPHNSVTTDAPRRNPILLSLSLREFLLLQCGPPPLRYLRRISVLCAVARELAVSLRTRLGSSRRPTGVIAAGWMLPRKSRTIRGRISDSAVRRCHASVEFNSGED